MSRVATALLSLAPLVGCADQACDAAAAAAAWDCGDGCGAPGTLHWQRSYQGGVVASAWDLAVDACGGLVLVGSVAPDRTGEDEAWVSRYDAEGELEWLRVTEKFGRDWAGGVAATADGGVVVVGQTIGEFINYNDMDSDASIARYRRDGSRAWVRTFDDGEYGWAGGVAIDRLGRAVVVSRAAIRWLDDDGTLAREIAIPYPEGPGRIVIAGDGRIAVAYSEEVAVLAEDGVELWRRPAPGPDTGELAFMSDGTLLVLAGRLEAELHAYDSAGAVRWSRIAAAGEIPAWANYIAVDGDDRIVVAGTNITGQRRQVSAAALDTTGEEQWRWSLDVLGDSEARGVVAGPDGSALVIATVEQGHYTGSLDQDVWIGRLVR